MLFAGLSALGSTPRRAAAMLRHAGVGRNAWVLDLGCGKGAVAVEVARALGCRVVGVDAFQPFVLAAREAAMDRDVAARCTFHVADAARFRPARRFDAALMLGLFPMQRAAPLLRRLVWPGGVYLIDDAFLEEGVRRRKAFAGVLTRTEARAFLCRSGDALLEEHVPTPSELARLNGSIYRRLLRNARALERRQPRLAPALRAFLECQQIANQLLAGPLRGATWVMRRTT